MELQLTPPDAGPRKDAPDQADQPDQLVGVTKFAKEVGVSRTAVYKRIDAGTLGDDVVVVDGKSKKILLNAGKRAWFAHRDARADLHDEAPQSGTATAAGATAERSDYRDAKTRTAQINADRAELELLRMQDELRPKDEVAAAVQTVFTKTREILTDRLPARADDLVAAAETGGASAVRALLAEIGADTCARMLESLQRIAEADRDFDEEMSLDG